MFLYAKKVCRKLSKNMCALYFLSMGDNQKKEMKDHTIFENVSKPTIHSDALGRFCRRLKQISMFLLNLLYPGRTFYNVSGCTGLIFNFLHYKHSKAE